MNRLLLIRQIISNHSESITLLRNQLLLNKSTISAAIEPYLTTAVHKVLFKYYSHLLKQVQDTRVKLKKIQKPSVEAMRFQLSNNLFEILPSIFHELSQLLPLLKDHLKSPFGRAIREYHNHMGVFRFKQSIFDRFMPSQKTIVMCQKYISRTEEDYSDVNGNNYYIMLLLLTHFTLMIFVKIFGKYIKGEEKQILIDIIKDQFIQSVIEVLIQMEGYSLIEEIMKNGKNYQKNIEQWIFLLQNDIQK